MKTLLFALTLLFTWQVSHAQQADTLTYCITPNNLGIGGFDPVSYFNGETPKQGNKEITSVFDGVVYQFASDANRKKFIANPKKYLPQFGGWCSMTLAMGRATTPKYDNFIVKEGKLYLFERTLSVNGRELWLQDPEANEKIASKNYTSYRKTGKIN